MTREEARNLLNNSKPKDNNAYSIMLNEALDMAIKALEQETKWIPVDDRLPKDDDDVLVCFPQGGMAVAYYHIDDTHYPTQYEDLNETGWFNEEGDAFYFEPIAWMPLPKPYEPQESEDKE